MSQPIQARYSNFEAARRRKALLDGTCAWPGDAALYADLVTVRMASLRMDREPLWEANQLKTTARWARQAFRCATPLGAGDLVMLVQEGKPPKLQPRWRGPFKVLRRAGRASYRLGNLDGSKPTGSQLDFHEDALRLFVPRSGHLKGDGEELLPGRQALRRPRPGPRGSVIW